MPIAKDSTYKLRFYLQKAEAICNEINTVTIHCKLELLRKLAKRPMQINDNNYLQFITVFTSIEKEMYHVRGF